MKIIVIGSGVVGVATAWYLNKAGHDVTVIDKHSHSAEETSAGNAGQVSPGYAAPWAAPGIPIKALKWLFQSKHAPLAFRPDGTAFQLSWIFNMMMNCTSHRYSINKSRMVRLAEYSRDCLKALRQDTGINYEHRTQGTLQLFRTLQQYENADRDINILKEYGVDYELYEAKDLIQVEPGMNFQKDKFSGGLRLPNDETGDCKLFTKMLSDLAASEGVVFKYNQSVEDFLISDNTLKAVRTDKELLSAERVIVCGGSWSRDLLKSILKIPVYPVKGYSITVPIINPEAAPQSTILDETYKVAVTRFDNRIRVGGMAELSGYRKSLPQKRLDTLLMVVHDLFPLAANYSEHDFWTGLRPMTPDGTPIIGKTPIKNLFLNTGHGTLGWTMACGSGKLISDIISDVEPDIKYDDLSIHRYF
ncbi:D-amino acid dehydrogenase [Klebsiella aerogenes]|nr:D-amino acid dehydrogenase [Klebsiella aerogenes]